MFSSIVIKIALLMWWQQIQHPDKISSATGDYLAAIYTAEIDMTRANKVISDTYGASGATLDSNATVNTYYIQYGRNIVIEILDPIESRTMPVFVSKLDYSKLESEYSIYFERTGEYQSFKKPIVNELDKSIGSVESLCEKPTINSLCDSVYFIMSSTGKSSKLFFNELIPNITTRKLFYPDITYLPHKVLGVGNTNTTMHLTEVIHGKSQVDSLLSLFAFENYVPLPKYYQNLIDTQFVKDLMEKMKGDE